MQQVTARYDLSESESQHFTVFKLLLMVMVVFAHSYVTPVNFSGGVQSAVQLNGVFAVVQYIISQCISRCAIPGFFIMSAILFYRKPFVWRSNVWKKVKTLLVPYLILNIFWIAVYASAQKIPQLAPFFARPDRLIAEWGLKEYAASIFLDPIPYHLWFLRDLFLLNLLAYLVDRLSNLAPKILITLLTLFWIFAADGQYSQNIQSICFWTFGCCMVKLDLHLEMLSRLDRRIIYPLYFLLIALDVWLLYKSGSRYWYMTTHKLLIFAGVPFWYDIVMCFSGETVNKKLLWLASFSFGIYLFHEMGMSFIKKIIAHILPVTTLSAILQYLLLPFFIIALCVLGCMLMKRFTPALYYLLMGQRKA